VTEANLPLRKRFRWALTRRISGWLNGPGILAPGDPRQRLRLTDASWPLVRTFDLHPESKGEGVTIGRYSGMHATATIMHSGEHHTDWVSLLGGYRVDGEWVLAADDATFDHGPVVIGNDVWVGFEALILSGVTIGDGAAIGARAVVRRSVEPYEIVAGNPIRHLGYRFDEPTREALLRIKWWDWPDEKVAAHRGQIFSSDVAGFVAGHDPELSSRSCPLCS
jgi:serine acetyltransferase